MPYVLLIFAVLTWGVSFLVTGEAIASFPFFPFIAIRFTLAAIILQILLKFSREKKPVQKSDRKKLALLFLAQPIGYFLFETLGLKFTSAANVALILSFIPLITLALEKRFNQEKITPLQKLGILFTLLATMLFVWYDKRQELTFTFWGELFALLATLAGCFYMLLSRQLSKSYPSLQLTTYQFTFASLFFLPLSISGFITLPSMSLKIVLSLVFLIVFCTILAFLAVNHALKNIPSSRASSLLSLIPMVTVLGSLCYGKTLDWPHYLFITFAVAGTWITNRKQKISPPLI
ncbi:MAG: hypothetical protein CVV50_00935 [Spirochaetae bacterium HGW-Spirochaetae-6]|nr:MAG: hypothetical protein CVV50_00935 [Spirochaetae bacterium HGW-Spirochaetae-6]